MKDVEYWGCTASS